MTDTTDKHPFSADRPIASREEDLLGRSHFAESLASAIKGWKGNESLVVALHGPWGSGKSSIKNMVLETLHHPDKTSHIILQFNPWQWAGHEESCTSGRAGGLICEPLKAVWPATPAVPSYSNIFS